MMCPFDPLGASSAISAAVGAPRTMGFVSPTPLQALEHITSDPPCAGRHGLSHDR